MYQNGWSVLDKCSPGNLITAPPNFPPAMASHSLGALHEDLGSMQSCDLTDHLSPGRTDERITPPVMLSGEGCRHAVMA